MKRMAFTLIEVLLAMAVIGIIAAATVNSIKNVTSNKTKLAFRNAYNHAVQTVNAISTDETIYPNVINTSSGDKKGHFEKRSMCELSESVGLDFPKEFRDASKYQDSKNIVNDRGYAFDTPGGIYWAVYKQYSSCHRGDTTYISGADYIIMFDINGPYEGTNCPYNILNPTNDGSNCTNPDTFKFGIAPNNDIIRDNSLSVYNNKSLTDFIKDNDYLQTK